MATPTGGLDLGSLIQAANLGRSLNPEVMQQQALGNQLALQLQQLKLQEALHPEIALSREINLALAKQGYNPASLVRPAEITPSGESLAGITVRAPGTVGVTESDLLAAPTIDEAGFPVINQIPTAPERTREIINPVINPFTKQPTAFVTDLSKAIQGATEEADVARILNAPKNEAAIALAQARARTPGGYAPKYFADVNGFQYTINPATNEKVYITDENGDPVNIGQQVQYLNTAEGFQQAPKRVAGGSGATPTPLTNAQGNPLISAASTTAKNTADAKIRNDLYKAVQSNAEVKEFETISRNFETLNSIVEDTLSDPSKLDDLATGRDTAAIDAFNIVFNPKGVVRQFSYVNTLQNRPLLDQGYSIWQRTFGSGGKITPEDLQSMRNLASLALENSKKSVKGQIKPILSRADKAGVAQDDILPDSLKNVMGEASQQPSYTTMQEAIAAGHKRGEKVIINGVRGTLQ